MTKTQLQAYKKNRTEFIQKAKKQYDELYILLQDANTLLEALRLD